MKGGPNHPNFLSNSSFTCAALTGNALGENLHKVQAYLNHYGV